MSISRFVFTAVLLVVGLIGIVWQMPTFSKQATGSLQLSAQMPGDVAKGASASAIDDFSWQSFVSVNWPAGGKGIIGQGGDHAAVWQFWKTDNDVLVPAGQVPLPWTQPSPIPANCTQKAPPGTRVLTQTSKSGAAFNFLMPESGPLIDQNGEYARFEILINEPMYDFILANKLYTVAGQKAYNPGGSGVQFPSGVLNGASGAVMLKVAWKILGPGDDATKFHTALAYLSDPNATPSCQLKQVGMVGLHISHKTQNAPQWVWSTFEHVDNAPLVGSTNVGHFNFSDGASKHRGAGCDSNGGCNQAPQGKLDPVNGDKTPVQVARLTDFTSTAKAANLRYVAALLGVDAASAFANYRLVGTQFPSDPANVNDPAGVMLPQFLANATIETYLQGDTVNRSSSCGACHLQAPMIDGRSSDFTFLLGRVGTN